MKKNLLKKIFISNQKRFLKKELSFNYDKFLKPSKEKFLNLKREEYKVPENYQNLLKYWSNDFLSYEFNNPNLLLDIFVLPSYLLTTGIKPQTTQLALVGSSILNFILSSYTYQQFNDSFHGKQKKSNFFLFSME